LLREQVRHLELEVTLLKDEKQHQQEEGLAFDSQPDTMGSDS
jgi:hypothetical protein